MSHPLDRGFGFSAEEIQALEDDRILMKPKSVPQISGTRKVSGTLLTPPSSQGSVSSSSSSSASVRFRSVNFSTNFVLDLPQTIDSVATLEFIGFTTETSEDIFERFRSRPNPNSNADELLDYVRGHILKLSSEVFQQYPPAEAMTRIGLSQSMKEAILDPQFTQVFGTATLHHWVEDTLSINFLTIIQLLQRLKTLAICSVAKKKGKRAKLEGVFPSTTAPPEQASTSHQIAQTASANMITDDHHLPKNFVAVVEGPDKKLPDHIMLYKAKAAAEMNDPQWIQEDGSVEMAALASHSGGDFNHLNPVWYWTLEPETAEMYRAWAERRCPWSDTWIIRIQVPNGFINGLKLQELWYSKDWKEYVWHCRKKLSPPGKFDSYWRHGGADIIKGHICTTTSTTLTRIKKEDVQEKISEDNILTISSGKATQWVFMQGSSVERLGAEIRGKIYIEITSAGENKA